MTSILRSLALYAAAGIACALVLVAYFRIWEADPHIPVYYVLGWDVFVSEMLVKTTVETGWHLTNPLLGAPGVLEFHDFPLPDVLHRLVIKLIASAGPDHGLTLNVFFFSAFFLETWACMFALRRLRTPAPVAAALGLLFAFLPFHFFRGQWHLSQGAYYPVPLMLTVVLWQCQGKSLFRSPTGRARPRLAWTGGRSWFAMAACLLTSASGAYETAFAVFFVVVGGMAAPRRVGARSRAIDTLALLVLLLGPFFIYLWPTIRYTRTHGANPEVAARGPEGASEYGLSILHLLVPNPGHRVPTTWHMVKLPTHSPTARQVLTPNENRLNYLGAVGVAGFLSLVAALLWNGGSPRLLRRLGPPSRLNLAAVLLGTTGGFGLVFAVLVSPMLRAYNRISIHIAFLSLYAASVILTAAWRRYASASDRGVFLTALALVFGMALFDQTTPALIPDHRALALVYARDRDFVRAIEAKVPRRAMIFQLPYVPFPENGRTKRMLDYDHLRPYFHSDRLHWSYGAMRGRSADLWQRSVAALPPWEMIERLRGVGFAGLYVDRFGYDDDARQLESVLRAYLSAAPIVSRDGRLSFYPLSPPSPLNQTTGRRP